MRVVLKGPRASLTPAIKVYIEEKLIRTINKLLPKNGSDASLLEIEFERTTRHHRKGYVWRVEANLTLGEKMLRAEAGGEDPREAIDILEEELKREVKKFKGRSKEKERRSGRILKKRLRGERTF